MTSVPAFKLFCRTASCAAVLAASTASAQYQRAWTVSGWSNRRDYAADITLDAAGNVYSAGYTEDVYNTGNSGLYEGGVAAKYDPAGNQEWLANAYSGRSLDHVADVRVDASSNVYIAGQTYRYSGPSEAFLIKFNSNGTRLWERHLGTADTVAGMSLAIDATGNAYVGGTTTGDLVGGGEHGYDPFLAKYDTSGTLLWVKQYADDALNEYPISMSISPDHGIYLGFGGSIDGGLARLDEAGTMLWFQKPNYSATPSLRTDIYGITSDGDGNVYAAGMAGFAYSDSTGFVGGKAVVAKHGLDGALLWSAFVPTLFQSSATDVALDLLGNIYVCGSTSRASGGADAGDGDAFWAKFSPQGGLLWFEQWGTESADFASGVAVDQAGRVFVSASTFKTINNYSDADGDVSIMRFDPVPEPTSVRLVATLALACASAASARKRRPSSQCAVQSNSNAGGACSGPTRPATMPDFT